MITDKDLISNLVNVQPMTNPLGSISFVKPEYKSPKVHEQLLLFSGESIPVKIEGLATLPKHSRYRLLAYDFVASPST